MALTLAKGRRRVGFLPVASAPGSWSAVSLASEVANIKDLSCSVALDGFTLGFVDSDTVDDAKLCDTSNVKALDASNFEAKFAVYRFLVTNTGASDTGNDVAWTTLGSKGVEGWLLERPDPLPLSSVGWTSGDTGIAYPVKTDNPQQPTDVTGYMKMVVPFVPNGTPIAFTIST